MYRYQKILKENKNIIKSKNDVVQPIRSKINEIEELISDMEDMESDGNDTSRIKSAINNLDKQIENMFYEYYYSDDSGDSAEAERKEKIDSTEFPHVVILEQYKDKLSSTLKKKHNMWNMQVKKFIKSGSEKVYSSIIEQSRKLSAEYQSYLKNPNSAPIQSAQKGGAVDYQSQLDAKNRQADAQRQQQRQEKPESGNSMNILGFDWDF